MNTARRGRRRSLLRALGRAQGSGNIERSLGWTQLTGLQGQILLTGGSRRVTGGVHRGRVAIHRDRVGRSCGGGENVSSHVNVSVRSRDIKLWLLFKSGGGRERSINKIAGGESNGKSS